MESLTEHPGFIPPSGVHLSLTCYYIEYQKKKKKKKKMGIIAALALY